MAGNPRLQALGGRLRPRRRQWGRLARRRPVEGRPRPRRQLELRTQHHDLRSPGADGLLVRTRLGGCSPRAAGADDQLVRLAGGVERHPRAAVAAPVSPVGHAVGVGDLGGPRLVRLERPRPADDLAEDRRRLEHPRAIARHANVEPGRLAVDGVDLDRLVRDVADGDSHGRERARPGRVARRHVESPLQPVGRLGPSRRAGTARRRPRSPHRQKQHPRRQDRPRRHGPQNRRLLPTRRSHPPAPHPTDSFPRQLRCTPHPRRRGRPRVLPAVQHETRNRDAASSPGEAGWSTLSCPCLIAKTPLGARSCALRRARAPRRPASPCGRPGALYTPPVDVLLRTSHSTARTR